MKITFSKIFVDDQDKALDFYTKKLGFMVKQDVTSDNYRWLTLVSPEDKNGTELLLEKNDNPPAKTYQKEIYKQGAPATIFWVKDIQAEYERLKSLDVKFSMEPTDMGVVTIAILDDTCGNLIQLAQSKESK